MKRVEVRLNLEAVAPLLDVIKAAVDDLGPALAVPQEVPDPEVEFADEWRSELLRIQNEDTAQFLGLFGSDFFSTGLIALEPGNAVEVLRACSAVRLRLRERHLKALGDDALETGDVRLDSLAVVQRKAFSAYVFLATLQELIIQHLDPTVME